MHSTQTITTLGLTTYLFGLAAGALITAPLTEVYGRKPVSLICMCMFAAFIIPCALSESLAMLLVFRFLAAFFGSVMVAASPGMVSDMVTEKNRSLCFSIWGLGPLSGPVIGPIVGGFATQYLSWRWANWLICIAAGSALLVSISMRESYAPIILQQRAAHLRKITGDRRWWSRYESKDGLVKTLRDSIKRPIVMAVTEPICIFWNLYVGVLYGILYLSFTAYPVVFGQIRGWSSSISSLSFLGIGLGTILVIVCEPVIRKLTDSDSKDPKRKVPPEAVVSAICVCSILVPIGELWFAWTCTPASIHWIVPILAGVPFGAGNTGVFIYASSYLTRSYGVFAASAMVGNCVIRTMLGGITPFVGTFMFSGIGPNWSATILGLIEVLLIPIPLYFLKHGRKIREKTAMIAQLTAENERLGAGGGQERQEGQTETAEV
ncbi:hypothetical protein ASPWEDRAFT_108514 [Aspergillus wentii DTO 134E9]|uniref:Major facilitator superfamily (MFS) profile domain-containing protein n=1 Tax=Aspergillus wentii DTO 134E9 TaxID=1073089 RepID=A0A1L9RNY2_ASPWE|nr:uncharacterized protein ASPWEDRAFT_108514 [Aspergillus wentii DTO 134E9]OJJ36655.1 hypothetical protein ASPWEDRAFT_108514 [Aspergillus wentii DTO 134E9]